MKIINTFFYIYHVFTTNYLRVSKNFSSPHEDLIPIQIPNLMFNSYENTSMI